jgi:hypothetical protein
MTARWDAMQLLNIMDQFISTGEPIGTYGLQPLLDFMGSEKRNGIGFSDRGGKTFYLFFVEGEPDGALFMDDKGVLLGDKAILQLNGAESFKLYPIDYMRAQHWVMVCRIFDNTHLKRRLSTNLPSLGQRTGGVGLFTLTITRDGEVAQGFNVTVRKDRQVVAADVTNQEGKVTFKLLYGNYDCVVMDRTGRIEIYLFKFDNLETEKFIEFGDPSPSDE